MTPIATRSTSPSLDAATVRFDARSAIKPTVPATSVCCRGPAASRTGRRVWALEGTGSFAAGLVAVLAEAGEDVVEIQNMKRVPRREE